MPPIPVHIEDPISPTKARTAEPQPQTLYEPSTDTPPANHATTTAATTAAPTSTQAYPSARPAAVAALPSATPTAQPYTPQPTRTQPPADHAQSDVPPPPQPGDAPSVVNATAFSANATTVPPPPKAGSAFSTQPVTVPPPQAQYSPPELNLAPTHTTDPTAAHSSGATANGAASLNPVAPIITSSAQHPPGYVQDVYAQELNPAQRASLDMQQEKEKKESGGLGAGLLGGNVTGGAAGNGVAAPEAVGEAWDAVKSWSGDAGKKASQLAAELHEAAWKWTKK